MIKPLLFLFALLPIVGFSQKKKMPENICDCVELSLNLIAEIDDSVSIDELDPEKILGPEINTRCNEISDELEAKYEADGKSYEDWIKDMESNCPAYVEFQEKMHALMELRSDELEKAFQQAMEEAMEGAASNEYILSDSTDAARALEEAMEEALREIEEAEKADSTKNDSPKNR